MQEPLAEFGRFVVVAAVLATSAACGGGALAEPAGAPAAAVVDITATIGYKNESGAGTGIVLTSSGEILTNNHVIRGATRVRATDVSNGRSYAVTVVGYDVSADVAVLKLTGASGLKTISIGASSRTRVGEAVTALGNAQGIGGAPSAARGRVLALGTAITSYDSDGTSERLKDMIETNAPTQAGDSGGPLVDSAGGVIGVNTAGSPRTERAWAIPIARALAIATLIETGGLSATDHIGPTPLLGVAVATSQASPTPGNGVVVNLVLWGSPAQRAGVVVGDVLTTVAGRKIASPAALVASLLHRAPHDSVAVSWLDPYGRPRHAYVRLGTGPSQ